MKRIVLISCTKKKNKGKLPARKLYAKSDLFSKAYAYAKSLNPDDIYILSAKYGLVHQDQIIEPYEKTLKTMKKDERLIWSSEVLMDLSNVADLDKDQFIFLAGEKYREFLVQEMENYEVPMLGLGMGEQMQWLKAQIEK